MLAWLALLGLCVQPPHSLICQEHMQAGTGARTLSTLFATTIFTASSTVEYMSTSFIQMSSMLSKVSRRVTSYAAQEGLCCQMLSRSPCVRSHLAACKPFVMPVVGPI